MREVIVLFFLLVSVLNCFCQAEERYTGPIIDMHLHAYTNEDFWGPAPNPATGEMSVTDADAHRELTVAYMKKNNIVLGVVDGKSPLAVAHWKEALGDGIVRALYSQNPGDLDLEYFKTMIESGDIELLGEIGTNYAGYAPSDPVFDPYWELCEKYDIPVGIHTGGSFPGIHRRNPDFRLRYGDPLLVEDIIVKYPGLRIYLMHAGGHFYERAAVMMVQYPDLYVDIAVLNWVPDAGNFLVPFLKKAKEYDVLDRVMFGSDQMIWPEAIEMAIENIQTLDFLTIEEKKGIFYDNAARFLNLSEETISGHHKRQ